MKRGRFLGRANRNTSVTYPSGKVVARSYSDRDELSNVKYDGNDVITRSYDDGGRLTSSTYGNGLVESRTYRNDNLTSTIGIPSVTSFSYGWDANKNKTAETDGIVNAYSWSTGTTGYDALDRLVGWNRTNGDSQSWNLSKVGDWTSTTVNGTAETRTHDGVHQLTAQGANALAYDPKGNLTRNAGDTADRYAWDFDNKLKSADTNTDGTNDVLFAYDALGRRTAKTSGGNTTVYVSSLNQEIAEYVSGANPNAPTYEYVFGVYIDEVLLRVTAATGTKHYYHQDSLFCVRALTDNTGAVVERYAYDPYGRAIYLTGAGALAVPQSSTVGNTVLYTGRRLDPETSLYYYRARYHDPIIGRFVGRDPKLYVDGPHLYGYVRSAPYVRVDPRGLSSAPLDAPVPDTVEFPSPDFAKELEAATAQFEAEIRKKFDNVEAGGTPFADCPWFMEKDKDLPLVQGKRTYYRQLMGRDWSGSFRVDREITFNLDKVSVKIESEEWVNVSGYIAWFAQAQVQRYRVECFCPRTQRRTRLGFYDKVEGNVTAAPYWTKLETRRNQQTLSFSGGSILGFGVEL